MAASVKPGLAPRGHLSLISRVLLLVLPPASAVVVDP